MLGLFEGPVEPLGGFAVLDPDGASVGAPLGLMTVCFVQQFGHWAAVGADPAAVPDELFGDMLVLLFNALGALARETVVTSDSGAESEGES